MPSWAQNGRRRALNRSLRNVGVRGTRERVRMRRIGRLTAAAALLLMGLPAPGAAGAAAAPGRAEGFITVSSGVELRYFLETPSRGGPFPTILLYDPYYAGTSLESPLVGYWRFFVPHGYAVIGVNIR